ncbi:hypothetical protein LTR84_008739 [Exophiala bonariae]|uniref:VWA7 N-terminal domain-containing protein n=1 Tax=Exophiala bonariae TaxID=1690606 RepID=A0AAV9MWL0_9EURO|nr:hypothetical protein LTR84_008739 [Exophiala bonariae]
MGCLFKTAANVVNFAPFTCANNLMNPFIYPSSSLLTSGYFGSEAELHSNTRTVQKYNHGGPFDRGAYGREGISKYTESFYFSPKPNMPRDAVKYAEEATVQYLNQVKDEICQQTPKASAPLRLLYGVGPILYFGYRPSKC